MSAGMAGVIAAHNVIYEPPQIGDCGRVEIPSYHYCQCCATDTCFDSPQEHAAHVAEELAKAGYELVDPLAVALADPEGHALVKAIHDRKAEA